jgi:hypothetical protein
VKFFGGNPKAFKKKAFYCLPLNAASLRHKGAADKSALGNIQKTVFLSCRQGRAACIRHAHKFRALQDYFHYSGLWHLLCGLYGWRAPWFSAFSRIKGILTLALPQGVDCGAF